MGQLVTLSCTPYGASTCVLSTWWSTTVLIGKPSFKAGFTLRCFQRLSIPYIATQLRSWQNDWYTRGTSNPVLSY